MSERELAFAGSSSIAGASYDETTETLTMEFTTGRTYRYWRVPKHVVDALEAAPSPGSFWYRQRGAYAYQEI